MEKRWVIQIVYFPDCISGKPHSLRSTKLRVNLLWPPVVFGKKCVARNFSWFFYYFKVSRRSLIRKHRRQPTKAMLQWKHMPPSGFFQKWNVNIYQSIHPFIGQLLILARVCKKMPSGSLNFRYTVHYRSRQLNASCTACFDEINGN